MESITLHDRKFRPYISAGELDDAIQQVADQISADYTDREPVFVCILTGAFMFLGKLMEKCNIPAEVAFWKVSSYNGGLQSSGVLKESMPLTQSVEGRDVIIVEDIIDTGFTMQHLIEMLRDKGAKSVAVCTLLHKPAALKYPIQIDYCALRIPNDFIVGFGLDYQEIGRNLPEIYVVDKMYADS